MCKMLQILIVILVIVKNYGFNIDTNFPIIYVDPTTSHQRASYFGYSLILYPGNNVNPPWILIGAPRANDTINNIFESGVCFKCRIGAKCTPMKINTDPVAEDKEMWTNSWIGNAMDINYNNERAIICAYRWIRKIKRHSTKDFDYYMQGSCFWFHINQNTTQKLMPLYDDDRAIYTDPNSRNSVYNYAQGQSGFSVHMAQKEAEMVLGAPGVFNWDGTCILYKDNNKQTPIASKLQDKNKRYADPHEFAYKNVASAVNTKHTLAYDLMGYSVTSGYFYNRNSLYYVSGAPRSNKYFGQVLIYQFAQVTELPLRVREFKYGTQFGEYFGASLVAGDLDHDGYDDLIIGAPFHNAKNYNEGKIYVFMGSSKGLTHIAKRDAIIGSVTNGQFGTTLQFLGDIDHDGYGDLAVSAPYEEETSGVVYIYRGTKFGLDTAYSQRIIGRDISPEIRGFGISMSRPADVDLNRHSDIAVGAHLSGHVVLLRTRPTVTIYHTLLSFSPQLSYRQMFFQIQACFWYKLNQTHAPIKIQRIISVDHKLGRASLNQASYNEYITLNPSGRTCQNITVALAASFVNRYDPITVTLSHKFVTAEEKREIVYVTHNQVRGTDRFCPRCPIYNQYDSSPMSSIDIPFALNCGDDNICKANLAFESKFINLSSGNTYVLDSTNYITLQTSIRNTGENAYFTQIVITVPETVSFRSTPSSCAEQNSSSVQCLVDNPLETNSEKMITVELDMTNLNNGENDETINFTVTVLTSSTNENVNTKNVTLNLRREADVTISGKSGEQSYLYGNITNGNGNFTQTYQVEKFGPSSINQILIEINVPHKIRKSDGTMKQFTFLFPPQGNIGDQIIFCTSNFTYLLNVDSTPITEDIAKKTKKIKRQVEVFNKTNRALVANAKLIKTSEFEMFENRTFYLNCGMSEIICSKIQCLAGPIKSGQIANVKLKMMFDTNVIKDFLEKKDVILFSTHGVVKVVNPENFMQNGDKPDSSVVSTLFIGESITESVELWIIILSVIAGLLLLLFLILGLIKAGFFKRTTKEELEQLKKEMEENENHTEEELEENVEQNNI